MFILVNIRDEVIRCDLRWPFYRSKEVGLVVWVDGRPYRDARIFFQKKSLSLGGGAVQAITECCPFVCAGK